MKHRSPGLLLVVVMLYSALYAGAEGNVLRQLATLQEFAAPECVVVDGDTGMAYVSNMATGPDGYWQDTGQGFISRLKADGTLDRLKWIESTPGFIINQPKGMAILGGRLYVADNKRVLAFSLADATAKGVYTIAGAQRLNDMTAGGDRVYVSDVATGRIHRLDTSGAGNHAVIAEIEGGNGITLNQDRMFAVSWTLHEVYEVDLSGATPPAPFGLSAHFTNLDGIEVLPDGTFILSDFMGNKISRISADRKDVQTLHTLTTPADIGVDFRQMRVYIPQLESDKVVIAAFSDKEDTLSLSEVRDAEFLELQCQIVARPTWDNERLAREALRPESLILESDRTPLAVVWRRTCALLDHLQSMENAPDLSQQRTMLEALYEPVKALLGQDAPDAGEMHRLFHEVCALRRQIAFSNPLLDFDRILFLKRHKSIFEHMCDQYYGITARPGGGLFILENAFTDAPLARNVLENSVVERGRLQGETLRGGVSAPDLFYDGEGRLTETGEAGGGAFLSPDLSYDGSQVLFAYVECRGDKRHKFRREETDNYWKEPWDPGRAYHLFRVNVDGTGLEQLTDGPWNDMHPCWMPDGRVVFVSERRGGFLRCGRVCPTYTMYQTDDKGKAIHPLSYHETHEWLPSVDNNGMLVYTRWDYVDRDNDIAHHLWLSYPDGRDPRGPHGNYPQVRESRPWMEMSIRAIPGSHRYAATASTHHGQHFGSLITIDLRLEDDRSTGQIRRVTPEAMFPEAESAPGVPQSPRGGGNNGQVYGTPWPLNEDFYLAVCDPGQKHHDLYLVDAFGNKELIYRDPEIACSNPIPLKPRFRPPVIPVKTRYEAREEDQPKTGIISVMNIYDSRMDWPEGTKIKELRLIQLFPKSTPAPGEPNIGAGDESIARGVLGTVPVEDDGSVHFNAPAGVTFYFQALDERGMAVQNMNSATYLHPGEHLSCAGCHEPVKNSPTLPERVPIALRNPPRELRPEPEGSYPLQFSRLVQPVLDAKCVACHAEEKTAPKLAGNVLGDYGWSQAFLSLQPFVWAKHGGNFTGMQRNKTAYSIPGEVGARASKLYSMLNEGHYDVKLTPEELRRITLWIDGNSVFYGAYHDLVAQAEGKVVMPHLK